jgi:threonine/homoserine/homoserine lactone efflux protein
MIGLASPGPNILAVIGTSMGVGRASGMALALGIAVGSLSWGLLTLIGLSALLKTYAYSLIVIKVFGGAYLLFLAYKAFKSAASKHDLEAKALEGGAKTAFGYALRGFIIQMTNPKAALIWIAIISLGLAHEAPLWVGLIIVIGAFLLSLIAHQLYAFAFSTNVMVRLYSKARRSIQAGLGTFFALAGLKLLTSKN